MTTLTGEHDSTIDSKATMLIFLKFKKEWEEKISAKKFKWVKPKKQNKGDQTQKVSETSSDVVKQPSAQKTQKNITPTNNNLTKDILLDEFK